MKDYHKPGYWKDWYWNKGGRDKVQYSRKVVQPNNYNKKHGNQLLSEKNSLKREEERAL